MGGKNPIKQIASGAVDVVSKPFREVARAAGADGAVDWIDKQRGSVKKIANGVVDKVSGRADRLEENAKEDAKRQAGIASAAAKQRQMAADKAANDVVESNRMSVGSESRTLLTGGAGLEDDENLSVSRRTLAGS